MTGNGPVDTMLLIAAVLGAVVTIGVSVRRIWLFVDSWEDAFRTLKEIADEFKPNGGSSLHDRITTLEQSACQIQRDLESVLIEKREGNVVRTD